MRIGSGVQSASEVFGKQQNNSKTYVAENEEFSQTSVKVYLKTDDMLFSGGNGTGLSFYIKYAEESTEDNPVVIAKGVYVPPHQAVIHQFAREMLAESGAMILGSDSHTRYGALGTMAVGEGGPDSLLQ